MIGCLPQGARAALSLAVAGGILAFLGRCGIGADRAVAAGFLFHTVTLATALPGAFILLLQGVRPPMLRAGRL